MAKTKHDIGKEVEAYCTKCKAATVHVISSMKENDITKVMCKSCQDTHKYRPPEEIRTIKKKKKKTKKTGSRKWNNLMGKVDAENPIDYEFNRSYTKHDVIKHDKFGLGVIVKIVDNSKMNVVFQDTERTLVQNY